jgi:hypothetical protein
MGIERLRLGDLAHDEDTRRGLRIRGGEPAERERRRGRQRQNAASR